MKKNIWIINGPNLNLLGKRETDIYGNEAFESYLAKLTADFSDFELYYYQSNVEGELINKLQEVGFSADGIVFNGAGYTHTSVSIADAIAAITSPVIEVHISNIFAREEFRLQSLTAKNCIGCVTGLGLDGYRLALIHFQQKLGQ